MVKHELKEEYLDWMYRLVYDGGYSKKVSYQKLLDHLHKREFIYILDMDGNRADDGVSLRYHFGYERGYSTSTIELYLDDRPCSILEMMVSLSKRCEEDIMDDPHYGNRTGQWFWNMIVSLGLGLMTDRNYDPYAIDHILTRFMAREYYPDGRGGLFTIDQHRDDMRSLEIWAQMHRYLEIVVGD